MIGDDVEITILDIRGDKVRVGVNAPSRIPVHRKEIYLAIQEENARAAHAKTVSLNDAMNVYKKRSQEHPPVGKETRKRRNGD